MTDTIRKMHLCLIPAGIPSSLCGVNVENILRVGAIKDDPTLVGDTCFFYLLNQDHDHIKDLLKYYIGDDYKFCVGCEAFLILKIEGDGV
ncbi:MAG: hypothetical protein V3V41_08020 [Candidatus Heimdallarchaeota archaeon]